MGRETKVSGVLPFKMEGHRFLQVQEGLIQRFPLGHDGNLNTLGDIEPLALTHDGLHRLLKLHEPSSSIAQSSTPPMTPQGVSSRLFALSVLR